MGKGKSLKSALNLHQTRLEKKHKAAEAAKVTEQKQKGKGKAPPPSRPVIPFLPTDKILLVGEGNFSFARALVVNPPTELQHLPPANITATAYDSEHECLVKYPDAEGIVSELREHGVEVIFAVDATKLDKCVPLKRATWDRIVFNFPHAGKGIADQDRNILSNQMLILDFLASAAELLCPGPVPEIQRGKKRKTRNEDDDDGEDISDQEPVDRTKIRPRGTVLISLRNVPPYTAWDVPRLAKQPPLPKGNSKKSYRSYTLLRSFVFHRTVWKGYEHRMTKGERAHGQGTTGQGGEDRTWEFCLQTTDDD